MSNDGFSPLEFLKSIAHARRVCRDRGWPTADDIEVDSGNDPEPETSDEFKAKYEQAWLQLSYEEQELLAGWRKKHLGWFTDDAKP